MPDYMYAWSLGVENEQQVEEMMVVEENGGMWLDSLNKVRSLCFHAAAGEPGTEDDVQAVDSFPHGET